MRQVFLSGWRVGLVFAAALCGATTTARAETYDFTAGPYTVFVDFTEPCATGSCANFTDAMRVSGTLTTAAPFPPNLTEEPVRSLLTGLRFTDGLNTFDLSDPQVRMRRANVSTDATGAVTGIDFLVQRWETPGGVHLAGDRLDQIRIATGSSVAFNNLFCNTVAATVDADSCLSVNLDSATSRAEGPGAPVTLLISLTSSGDPSVFGQSVTFTASVTGSSPTGPVAFFDGATPLCTTALSGNGNTATATCTTSALTVGSHAIRAEYPGDVNNSATSGSLTHTVNTADTTTTITAVTPASIALGASATISVSVAPIAPGAGSPSGMVTVTLAGDAAACTATLSAGVATCTLAPAPSALGVRTVTAAYAGDANFVASSDAEALTVTAASSATSLASSASTTLFGEPVTFTATVSGINPTGTVTFLDGAVALCVGPVALSGGIATCTTGLLDPGTHSIVASYSGDSNNVASVSSAVTQDVLRIPTTTSIVSILPATLVAGQSATITVTLAGSAATVLMPFYPTGVITVSDGSASCTAPLPGVTASATVSCVLTPTAACTRTISASYAGDSIFLGSQAQGSLPVSARVPHVVPAIERWSLLLLVALTGLLAFASRQRVS
jgi:hypothetical protein